jgi:glycosyltransferase involved in cell wall biosynthesis
MALAGDTEQREFLRAAGLQRAAGFTWERCAQRTRAVYAALSAAVAA